MPSGATRVSMDELAACSTPTIGSSSVLTEMKVSIHVTMRMKKKWKKKNKSKKKRKERKNFAKSLGLWWKGGRHVSVGWRSVGKRYYLEYLEDRQATVCGRRLQLQWQLLLALVCVAPWDCEQVSVYLPSSQEEEKGESLWCLHPRTVIWISPHESPEQQHFERMTLLQSKQGCQLRQQSQLTSAKKLAAFVSPRRCSNTTASATERRSLNLNSRNCWQ